MIAYIFNKNDYIINAKIDNVIFVADKEIKGDTIIKFGDGSDYIILQSDTIVKDIGEIIDIANLTDCRDYFIKGKDYWYQNQISTLQATNDMYSQTLDTLMFDIIPSLNSTTN